MIEKNKKPSLVFFGTPDFAVASLEALIQDNFPILAVVTAPDKPAGRGRKVHFPAVKEAALQHNLPILQPEKLKNPEFLAQLKSLNADVHIVVAFRMLPEVVWNMPAMGTINVHGSLLPQYRGAAPINHAIMNGETETGVSTFRLQHEIDTGDVLLQKKRAIEPQDNFGTLYAKLMADGAALLIETLHKLSNHEISPIPQQIPAVLHHAPKIFKGDCEINWAQPAKKIHDFIRGLCPHPTAFTTINGKTYKILESDYKNNMESRKTPGEIETDNKTFLNIAASDGWLNILKLQPEGKKAMNIRDYLNGSKFE